MEIGWTIWNEAFFCCWTFPIFMVGEFLEWLQTSSPTHTHTHTWWPSNLLSYHIRQKKKQNLLVPFPREWLFYVVLMVGEDHENFPRTFPKRHLLIGWVPTASPTGRCPVLRICCRKSSCPLFWRKDDDASRCREEGRCEDQWWWKTKTNKCENFCGMICSLFFFEMRNGLS